MFAFLKGGMGAMIACICVSRRKSVKDTHWLSVLIALWDWDWSGGDRLRRWHSWDWNFGPFCSVWSGLSLPYTCHPCISHCSVSLNSCIIKSKFPSCFQYLSRASPSLPRLLLTYVCSMFQPIILDSSINIPCAFLPLAFAHLLYIKPLPQPCFLSITA